MRRRRIAILALANGYPIGVPEVLAAPFIDLVEYGAIRRDWQPLAEPIVAQMNGPEGSLVGVRLPAVPTPARSLGLVDAPLQASRTSAPNPRDRAAARRPKIACRR